jgi:hypothetical protein
MDRVLSAKAKPMPHNNRSPRHSGENQDGGKMLARTSIRRAAVISSVLLAGVAVTAATANAATPVRTSTIYSSVPNPLKGNMPSLGFEATSTSEFGDDVTFGDTSRKLTSATVTMSSWGCQFGNVSDKNCVTTPGATFTVPITFKIYSSDLSTVLQTNEQTFNIPYRPSASPKCTGADAGKWFDPSLKQCFNGYAFNITFPFSGVTLPSAAVWSVAYNTSTAGIDPVGPAACQDTSDGSGGCGYDSLNVGLSAQVYSGTQPTPDSAYLNSTWVGAYCDGGTAGLGTFRLDAGCWSGIDDSVTPPQPFTYIPAVAFKTSG